jgi:hypothetical protein
LYRTQRSAPARILQFMSLISVMLIIWVGSALSLAQVVGKPEVGDEVDGPAILREAHAVAAKLAPAERAQVLSMVAHAANMLTMPEAESWARELFDTSASLDPTTRLTAQMAAAAAMSKQDAVAALAMLQALEPPPQPSGGAIGIGFGTADRHNDVPSRVFFAYFGEKGVHGVPQLKVAARSLSRVGGYPFAAWSNIVLELAAQAPAQAQAVFLEVVSAVEQTSLQVFGGGGRELMEFLQATSSAMPQPAQRAAIRRLVQRILTQPDAERPGHYRLTVGHQSAQFTNNIDAMLYVCLPTIRSMDPELAEELVNSRPELAAAPAHDPPRQGRVIGYGGSFYATGDKSVTSPPPLSLEQEELRAKHRREWELARARENEVNDLTELAWNDPEGALRAAETLTNADARAAVYVHVAYRYLAGDPKRGAEMLAKAKAVLPDVKDDRLKLECIIGIAQAALVLRDYATFERALAQTLAYTTSGPPPLRFGRMHDLIDNAMRKRPQQTLAAIRATRDIAARARWLAEAAIAVSGKRPQRRSMVGGITQLLD